jgi:hypothetical protein
MHRLYCLTPRQIRNRTRQFYALRAVIRPRQQIELADAQHDVAARIKL